MPALLTGGVLCLPLEPVDGADAEADQLGSLDDAGTLGQLGAGSLKLFLLGTRATEMRADNASLPANELAITGEGILDGLHPGTHPGLDHSALKLSKRPADLKQQHRCAAGPNRDRHPPPGGARSCPGGRSATAQAYR